MTARRKNAGRKQTDAQRCKFFMTYIYLLTNGRTCGI